MGIILMWVCVLLAFGLGFSCIANGSVFGGALCMLVFGLLGVFCYNNLVDDKTKKEVAEYERKKEEMRLTQGYRCPSCGAMAGHKIGAISKGASIGAFGLASNKIGKTYRCAKCDYMW